MRLMNENTIRLNRYMVNSFVCLRFFQEVFMIMIAHTD